MLDDWTMCGCWLRLVLGFTMFLDRSYGLTSLLTPLILLTLHGAKSWLGWLAASFSFLGSLYPASPTYREEKKNTRWPCPRPPCGWSCHHHKRHRRCPSQIGFGRIRPPNEQWKREVNLWATSRNEISSNPNISRDPKSNRILSSPSPRVQCQH